MNRRASIWISTQEYKKLCAIDSDESLVGEITMYFDQLDWNADVAPGIGLVAIFGTFDSYYLNGGCFMFFDRWHEVRNDEDYLAPILNVPATIPGCHSLEPILLKGQQLRQTIDRSNDERWRSLDTSYNAIRPSLFSAMGEYVRTHPQEFVNEGI